AEVCKNVLGVYPHSRSHAFEYPIFSITPGFEYICGQTEREYFCYQYDVCFLAHSKIQDRPRRNRELRRVRVQNVNGELHYSEYKIDDENCESLISSKLSQKKHIIFKLSLNKTFGFATYVVICVY
ncbi:hypothetical protein ROZALSC1DRAFT_25343, partial [Rozella allomycis CSF55]